MKKKILCLALGFLLVFGFIFVGCKGEDNVTISVGSATAKVGDTVKLPVTIKGNPGIMGLIIDFKFDSAQLKFIGFEKGKIFSDYETSDVDGTVRLTCLEDEDVKGDGELITLEFKVIGKEATTTEVDVALEENSICNYNEELIRANGESGTVKIKK